MVRIPLILVGSVRMDASLLIAAILLASVLFCQTPESLTPSLNLAPGDPYLWTGDIEDHKGLL